MLEYFLTQIPDDAPEMLTNFILEKEQELNGKLFVQLSYRDICGNPPTKNVVVTIFCKQPKRAFPLPEYNNVSIKTLLNKFKEHVPLLLKPFLAMIDVQKKLNQAFEKLESKHQGKVKIVIFNKENEGKIETIFKEIYPKEEKENSFKGFLDSLLANPESFNFNELL